MGLGLGIFGWIIIGGLAGWIASKIMKTDAQMGIPANIAAGVVGGLIGGGILTAFVDFDGDGPGKFISFLTCLAGACLVIWVVKKVKG